MLAKSSNHRRQFLQIASAAICKMGRHARIQLEEDGKDVAARTDANSVGAWYDFLEVRKNTREFPAQIGTVENAMHWGGVVTL